MEATQMNGTTNQPACIDCGQPATIYRDLGQGTASCTSCQELWLNATLPKPRPRKLKRCPTLDNDQPAMV
jgi:hypothetical protein